MKFKRGDLVICKNEDKSYFYAVITKTNKSIYREFYHIKNIENILEFHIVGDEYTSNVFNLQLIEDKEIINRLLKEIKEMVFK